MTADQVALAARNRVGTVSTQAVYGIGEPPCRWPAATSGFIVDEAEVTFWGLCTACHTTSKFNEKASAR